MALKIAKAAGCKVIVTSSSDAKLEAIRQFPGIGEISIINYAKNTDWDVEAVKLNGGVGVDIVIENGGTSSLLRSIKASAKRGIVSQVGYLGNQNPLDLVELIPRIIEKFITLRYDLSTISAKKLTPRRGINVGSRLELEQLNRVIEANQMSFQELIDKRFPFSQASDAFRYLWSGKHVGKVVIEVSSE